MDLITSEANIWCCLYEERSLSIDILGHIRHVLAAATLSLRRTCETVTHDSHMDSMGVPRRQDTYMNVSPMRENCI